VIKDLGLPSLGLWNESIIENIENVIADIFELLLNLGTVLSNFAHMLIGLLALFLCSIEEMMRHEALRVPTTFL